MIKKYGHTVEGFKRIYENENWTVALKNAGESNRRDHVNCLERHNCSDEIFILLTGSAVMMEGEVSNKTVVGIKEEMMELNKLYLIPQGVWHNTYMMEGARFVIIENCDTSYENTDVVEFVDIKREVTDFA